MSGKLVIFGYENKGYEGQIIKIEADIHPGFPGFDIIGLPDSAIKEARDRVRTALRNCNFKFPQQHVLVSLSPASVPKQGTSLDLGIALSILFANDKLKNRNEDRIIRLMTAGELDLSGEVVKDNSCIGALEAARKLKCNLCLLPFSVNKMPGIYEVGSLSEAFIKCGEFLNSEGEIPLMNREKQKDSPIFSDIIGLNEQKKLLSICAAGFHSVLIFGPPGVGKTMLSSRIGRLLPDLDKEDAQTVAQIYGCAGLTGESGRAGLDRESGFAPKSQVVAHDCSLAQFVGGSVSKSPGIGALSHCSPLILDEIVKYSPKLLEAVKSSYDKGYTLSCRSGEVIKYPSRFLLVANMNACFCGGLGSKKVACTCNSHQIEHFWGRLGRPIIERFDARIPIEEFEISDLINQVQQPDSYYLEKVRCCAERQKHRYIEYNIKYNGQIHYEPSILAMFGKEIEIIKKTDCGITNNIRNLIGVISLARTLADWEERSEVSENDILFSMQLKKYGLGDYFWRTIR